MECRHAAGGGRSDQGAAGKPALLIQPAMSAISASRPVRHRGADHRRRRAGHPLRARRARRAGGRRAAFIARFQKGGGRASRGVVLQLRPGGRAFRRPEQCRRASKPAVSASWAPASSPGWRTIWPAGRPAMPIVVTAHIPLWSIDEGWGWGTDDGDQALALLKRFGSVTVLNGHIHQVIQKVEGHVAFHTAVRRPSRSRPPARRLARGRCSGARPAAIRCSASPNGASAAHLAARDRRYAAGRVREHDRCLAEAAVAAAARRRRCRSACLGRGCGGDDRQFRLHPGGAHRAGGHEGNLDQPRRHPAHRHSAERRRLFQSPPLDTGRLVCVTFDKPGTYRYFCALHPHMQGTVVVT